MQDGTAMTIGSTMDNSRPVIEITVKTNTPEHLAKLYAALKIGIAGREWTQVQTLTDMLAGVIDKHPAHVMVLDIPGQIDTAYDCGSLRDYAEMLASGKDAPVVFLASGMCPCCDVLQQEA
jgi:hypothetical protein